MAKKKDFDWEGIYKEIPLEQMGWYHPVLDPDLKKALNDLHINSGTFLDLGAGAGNQAAELAKMGFVVTGTDIAQNAIFKATQGYPTVEFIEDDILQTKLMRQFDYIFDRGCFHNFSEDKRECYVHAISQLLHPNGILFLKCFSEKNLDMAEGPYLFSREIIAQIFKNSFDIQSIYDAAYQGTLNWTPKALFAIMRKK